MTDETSPGGQQIPSTVGRYQVTDTLGFGAMGAVYKAFDPLIKRTLAIKTIRLDIPRQSPQHAAFIERFYREARISGTLSHPNIVTLFDIGEEGGLPFLAMEYVDGCTVGSMIEAGTRLKPEKVIGLVSQVAAALDYAHSRGVVHRDIKPSNLIVYEDDKVKVTDFGIAKLADSEITHAGVLLGTPSYMSPEQAMGETLDGRSDIFSLGVCAFEMLSGQQPFPGSNVTAILYKLVHVDPIEPDTLEMNGLVPQKWREVFRKVLAKRPADRYQTAGAFVQDLEYCLGSWFTGLLDATVQMGPSDETKVVPGDDAATVVFRPESQDAGPATVKLPGAAEDSSTIRLKVGGARAETPRAPEPGGADDSATIRFKTGVAEADAPHAPGPGAPDDSSTVVLKSPLETPGGEETATVTLTPLPADAAAALAAAGAVPASDAVAAATPPQARSAEPPPVTEQQVGFPTIPSVTPGKPVPQAPARPRRPTLALLVAGGALALVVIGALTGWLLWSFLRGPATTSPEASLAPTATTPSAEPTPVSVATFGLLLVESDPGGARVRVNGEARGETPLEIRDLPFGSYDVRIEQRGFESQSQEVSLDAENPEAHVSARLRRRAAPATGSAAIVSKPPGATVIVDGRSSGRTPLGGVALAPGSHRLALTLEGYERWSGVVDVVAGQRTRVDVNLEPKAPPTPPPPDPNRIYALEEVDTKPRRRSGALPSYPERGAPRLKSGQRVSVLVRFVVTEKGEVRDVEVVESAGAVLDEAVTAAVREWEYEPATKQGTRVKCRTLHRQTFLGG